MLHGVTEGCAIQKEMPRWKYLRLYLRTNSLVNTHFQCFTVNHWKLWCFHLIWMSAHKLRCRRNLGLVFFFFPYLLMAIWYHNCFLVQLQIIYCGGDKFCVSLSITYKEQPQCQAAHYNPWRISPRRWHSDFPSHSTHCPYKPFFCKNIPIFNTAFKTL